MVAVEKLRSREGLTREVVAEAIFAAEREGEHALMVGETSYNIIIDGEMIMTFGEAEGVVRLNQHYQFLSERFRGLVDRLREIGYKIERT